MPFVKTERNTLYFADHRKDKSALPIILVHGAGGSHLDWPAELRRLSSANVIALDLAGHGKSPEPGRQTVREYALDLIAFMNALEITQAIIIGHSMGGAIAQTVALDHPIYVNKLILVGTGAKLSVHPDILDNILVAAHEVAILLKDWIWGTIASETMRDIAYGKLISVNPQIIYGDYLACNSFDIRQRLSEINIPTLIIGGTEDRMTPPKYSTYLEKHVPNAKLDMLEGCGHMMALERPTEIAHIITQWLKGIEQDETQTS